MHRVGRIVVMSAATRDELHKRFPKARGRVVVVGGGWSPREAAHAPSARVGDLPQPYALYVGTIEPRKNVIPLVEAFLATASHPWRLVLAGKPGWLGAHEEERFRTLCEDPRVTYLGYVSDAELAELYRGAAIFCYVSSDEGFGLPVLEAMAEGLPVINSDCPALVEVTGGASVSVRRAVLELDLARELRRLMEQPLLREQLSEAGIRQAARFNWDDTARRTVDVIAAANG